GTFFGGCQPFRRTFFGGCQFFRRTFFGSSQPFRCLLFCIVLTSVIDTGLMDLVDVELSRGEDAMKTIRDAAHKAGMHIIGSLHDFASTPSKERIVYHL
ncbi:type I 3-dehydroquinate dehydratase, partial [[Clostridium] symbiosum]|uniref:type I 3-dehydroquinate dehydratase n=1 Tax=Clostridium symbiosum TaxID=1512 RepID=UPI00210A84A9